MDVLPSIFSIVLIDLVLSGDNAIVIGMAAHNLPPKQRRLAILLGGAVAIVLRITLTSIAALLLTVAGLQAAGGAALLWIAFKLLKAEGESVEGVKAAPTLWRAMTVILVADFIMSTDNVLGVAAASGGDIPLLIFGLVLSIAILMLGGSLVAEFVNRLWWLAYVGAGVIAWTGIDMILEDPYVDSLDVIPHEAQLITEAIVTIAVLVVAQLVHRGRQVKQTP